MINLLCRPVFSNLQADLTQSTVTAQDALSGLVPIRTISTLVSRSAPLISPLAGLSICLVLGAVSTSIADQIFAARVTARTKGGGWHSYIFRLPHVSTVHDRIALHSSEDIDMAMIKCGECGNDVSSLAAACPRCGNPICTSKPDTANAIITTQSTSQKYKAHMIIACMVCCVGVILLIGEFPLFGVSTCIIGLIWFFIARSQAWWHNG